MFHKNFMTIDPATKPGSRRELMQAGLADGRVEGVVSNQNFGQDADEVRITELNSGHKSGQTLDIGKFISESRGKLQRERVPIPMASLMKGKSEFTYHLQKTENHGQIS